MPRLRTLAAFLALGAFLTAGGLGARAQVSDVPTTSTTSTTRPPGTTTTTAPEDDDTTPSTAPWSPGPGSPAPPGGPSGGGGDGGFDTGVARVVPPDYQKLINSVKRTRANNTAGLIDALRPLEDLGLTLEQAAVVGMGRFPVGGYATFSDDWWNPRFTPYFHLHEGTDIFAAAGTPVRSPIDGVLRHSEGPVGGLGAYVTQPDGTYFYLAHLSAFVEGQASGQRVKTGDVVGFVGDSGNARGGSPHLHLELHPRGGGPTNPKPYLDRFISEAVVNVPRVIAAFEAGRPRAALATGLTRRLSNGRSAMFGAPERPLASQLLWASSANPSGGTLALAQAAAAEAADEVDWKERARREQADLVRWQQARARARAILAPLTPPGLASLVGLPPA